MPGLMSAKEVMDYLNIGENTLARMKKECLVEWIEVDRRGKAMFFTESILQYINSLGRYGIKREHIVPPQSKIQMPMTTGK